MKRVVLFLIILISLSLFVQAAGEVITVDPSGSWYRAFELTSVDYRFSSEVGKWQHNIFGFWQTIDQKPDPKGRVHPEIRSKLFGRDEKQGLSYFRQINEIGFLHGAELHITGLPSESSDPILGSSPSGSDTIIPLTQTSPSTTTVSRGDIIEESPVSLPAQKSTRQAAAKVQNQVITTQPTTPQSQSSLNCQSTTCNEIDNVWSKISILVAKNKVGQIWDGGWKFPPEPQSSSSSTILNDDLNTRAKKLYTDLSSQLSNKNLIKAMVANAKGESLIIPSAAGDCGSTNSNSIPISGKGNCCSFGLWQYNVCGGLGVDYLTSVGNPSSNQQKLNELYNYNKQINFMTSLLNSKYGSVINQQRSSDDWIDWFVRTIEKPQNPDNAISLRKNHLKEFEAAGIFN